MHANTRVLLVTTCTARYFTLSCVRCDTRKRLKSQHCRSEKTRPTPCVTTRADPNRGAGSPLLAQHELLLIGERVHWHLCAVMKLARDGGSTEYVSDPDLTWPVTVAPPEHDQGVWRDAVVCERFGVQACVSVGACVWWGYVYMFEGTCAHVCEFRVVAATCMRV